MGDHRGQAWLQAAAGHLTPSRPVQLLTHDSVGQVYSPAQPSFTPSPKTSRPPQVLDAWRLRVRSSIEAIAEKRTTALAVLQCCSSIRPTLHHILADGGSVTSSHAIAFSNRAHSLLGMPTSPSGASSRTCLPPPSEGSRLFAAEVRNAVESLAPVAGEQQLRALDNFLSHLHDGMVGTVKLNEPVSMVGGGHDDGHGLGGEVRRLIKAIEGKEEAEKENEGEVARLSTRLAHAQEQVERLEADAEKREGEIVSLRIEVADAKQKIGERDAMMLCYKGREERMADLAEALQASRDVEDAAVEKCAALCDQVERSHAEVSAARREMDARSSELALSRAELAALRGEMDAQSDARRGELDAKMAELIVAKKEACARAQDLERERDGLVDELNHARQCSEALRSEMELARGCGPRPAQRGEEEEGAVRGIQVLKRQVEGLREEVYARVDELQGARARAEDAFKERDGALVARDAACRERDSAISAKDAAIAERNSALREREGFARDVDVMRGEWEAVASRFEAEKADLSRDNSSLVKEGENTRARIRKLELEREALRGCMERGEDERGAIAEEARRGRGEREELRRRVDETQREKEELEMRVRDERERQEAEEKRLKGELDEIKCASEAEIAGVRCEVEDRDAEIKAIKGVAASRDRELAVERAAVLRLEKAIERRGEGEEGQLSAALARGERVERELACQRERAGRAEGMLEYAQKQLSERDDEVKSSRERAELAVQKLEEVRARVLAQEAHLGRAKAVEEELAKARSRMEEAREQLKGYDDELALAREGLERARQLIEERGDELKAAVEGKERAEEERDGREAELDDVRGQLEEAMERCLELASRAGAQDVPLPKATPRRSPHTPIIRNTPKMVTSEADGGQVACLRRELEERDAEVAALEAEKEKLADELEERVGAAIRDAEKLVEEVMRRADLEAERGKERETERGGEALELRERVYELEAQLKEATVEKASLEERIAAFDADRTSLRVAVDEQVRGLSAMIDERVKERDDAVALLVERDAVLGQIFSRGGGQGEEENRGSCLVEVLEGAVQRVEESVEGARKRCWVFEEEVAALVENSKKQSVEGSVGCISHHPLDDSRVQIHDVVCTSPPADRLPAAAKWTPSPDVSARDTGTCKDMRVLTSGGAAPSGTPLPGGPKTPSVTGSPPWMTNGLSTPASASSSSINGITSNSSASPGACGPSPSSIGGCCPPSSLGASVHIGTMHAVQQLGDFSTKHSGIIPSCTEREVGDWCVEERTSTEEEGGVEEGFEGVLRGMDALKRSLEDKGRSLDVQDADEYDDNVDGHGTETREMSGMSSAAVIHHPCLAAGLGTEIRHRPYQAGTTLSLGTDNKYHISLCASPQRRSSAGNQNKDPSPGVGKYEEGNEGKLYRGIDLLAAPFSFPLAACAEVIGAGELTRGQGEGVEYLRARMAALRDSDAAVMRACGGALGI